MILQRLTELYDRLLQEGQDVAPKGWSTKAITFRVVIDHEGNLQAIQDAATLDGKRRVLPKMITPGDVSITSAILPEYLNGSSEYLLGFDPKGKSKRTVQIWSQFKDLHFEARSQFQSPAFEAVCRFLETWDPARLTEETKALLTEIGGRGAFYLAGEAVPARRELTPVERLAVHAALLQPADVGRRAAREHVQAQPAELELTRCRAEKLAGLVEHGRRLIGEETDVIVTSVLQTVAGRMIFARPKREGVPS